MPHAESVNVRLYYETSGPTGNSVLLLSNSIGSNLHMWDKVLRQFEGTHRVVRYDMRGHGQSSVPPGPYTMDQLGGDVLFLLDHLGIERADVCGLSVGGMIAMWLGIRVPDRIERLILANTAARIGSVELWNQRIAMARTEGMEALAQMTLGRWFTRAYIDEHPDEMETICAMIAATDAQGYEACCCALRDTDLRTAVAAIKATALVISGSDDPATPASEGRALHAALRDSRFVELEASHLSALEKPEEFAAAVLKFLNSEGSSHA
ncbi:MAG: 3-oxoadipate enol-lactonase [Silvibacterium sp.]|nr:3-oxoadipate enol-lactonase [Silvibacterium sp.]